ncbi:HAMP domain-containing histidine kinase [bacterium]|nr:HAMP domain-containing histidine kinase [bacterium]
MGQVVAYKSHKAIKAVPKTSVPLRQDDNKHQTETMFVNIHTLQWPFLIADNKLNVITVNSTAHHVFGHIPTIPFSLEVLLVMTPKLRNLLMDAKNRRLSSSCHAVATYTSPTEYKELRDVMVHALYDMSCRYFVLAVFHLQCVNAPLLHNNNMRPKRTLHDDALAMYLQTKIAEPVQSICNALELITPPDSDCTTNSTASTASSASTVSTASTMSTMSTASTTSTTSTTSTASTASTASTMLTALTMTTASTASTNTPPPPQESLTDEQCQSIRACCHAMVKTVNDLFTLSNRSSGFQYKYSFGNMLSFVEEALKTMKCAMFEANVRTKLVVHPAFQSHFVYCDGQRIEQVVRNFLSNAVQHVNAGGKITTKLKWFWRTSQRAKIVVQVFNTGSFVKDNECLFNDYIQARDQEETKTKTGLGLSICRNIVERGHDGRVWYMSDKKGSTFYASFEAQVKQSHK